MTRVSYVLPNVCEMSQRGGLLNRWTLAKDLGCDYVEVPADLTKNRSEMDKTGLALGQFLGDEDIPKLYKSDSDLPEELNYILHTEPSLVRHDGFGLAFQAPLLWNDENWRKRFAKMAVSISEFLNVPASVIEIHPGDKRNSFDDLLAGARSLLNLYAKEIHAEPLIMLENRTGQIVSTGDDIQRFWGLLVETNPEIRDKVGIVLDIQQLFTVTKKDFLKALDVIPPEAIRELHIHRNHNVPRKGDAIPWEGVFERMKLIKNDIIINPEVLRKNWIEPTIRFCQGFLG
jgi:hypothetical protein